MKRLISLILVLTLLLSITVIPGYAQGSKNFTPPGLAKKGGMPPGLAKKFNDIHDFEWARSAIEKMALKGIIKGVGENLFAPAKSVTKIEALAMIIRVMGWEEDADVLTDLISKGKKEDKLKNKIQDWGKGYVELALDKGLIDEIDLLQENFTTPAIRQEVAKYIIRALGKEDEAQKYMTEKLRFKDASAVQIGAVGYVYLIDKLGIMMGDTSNSFQPNKPVTRAEMAALTERLDEKVDSDTDSEVTGIITKLEEGKIQIQADNTLKKYDVDDDVIVYDLKGSKISFDKLQKGMTVRLYLYDEEVIYVQVIKEDESKIITDYEGIVKAVYSDKIQMKINKMQITFEVASKAVVKINGVSGKLSDIEVDDTAKVKIDDNNRIIAIYVTRSAVEQTVTGKLVAVGDNRIVIKDNNSLEVYDLADNVKVYINNSLKSLNDLEENESINLTLKDGKVTVVRWDYDVEDYNFSGTITNIYNSTQKIIVKSGNTIKTFTVTDSTDIELDGTDIEFSKLIVGMKVELKVEDNELIKLHAESIIKTYEGKLIRIEAGSQNKITIKIDNQEKTFVVDKNAEIVIDDEDSSFADLFTKYNTNVEVQVKNNIIIKLTI